MTNEVTVFVHDAYLRLAFPVSSRLANYQEGHREGEERRTGGGRKVNIIIVIICIFVLQSSLTI